MGMEMLWKTKAMELCENAWNSTLVEDNLLDQFDEGLHSE